MKITRPVFETWYGADIALNNTIWEERRCILPKRCISTGKYIKMFSKAVRGTRYLHRGKEYYWMSTEEYIMNKLKGRV